VHRQKRRERQRKNSCSLKATVDWLSIQVDITRNRLTVIPIDFNNSKRKPTKNDVSSDKN